MGGNQEGGKRVCVSCSSENACSHCSLIVIVIVLVQYVISHSVLHALNSVYIGAGSYASNTCAIPVGDVYVHNAAPIVCT